MYQPQTNLVFAIGCLAASVPEGLIVTITFTLMVSKCKLLTQGINVKNLESIETLGATSCICVDKTGTMSSS